MSEGYVKVSKLMSEHEEYAIFRRFKRLNLQNLLYLQAELTYLEKDLDEVVGQDKRYPERALHPQDWFSLAHGYEGDDDENREQWEKVLQIRDMLEKYNATLKQQVSLWNLPPPRKYDLDFLRSWIERPHLGNNPLTGRDRNSWSAQHQNDLLALHREPSSDPFSTWITQKCIPFLHLKFLKRFKAALPKESSPGDLRTAATPPAPETIAKANFPGDESSSSSQTRYITTELQEDFDGSQIWHYEDRRIVKAVNVFSIVVASMLPITSIIILYFVSETLIRLLISVLFTGLFAFCLAITTRAARSEIFAATSAFAAVQVVFMTGSNGHIGQ